MSTLQTLDATETLNRMIDLFARQECVQVRAMPAGTLRGIVGQRLTATKDGQGRVAVCEVMVSTGASGTSLWTLLRPARSKTPSPRAGITGCRPSIKRS